MIASLLFLRLKLFDVNLMQRHTTPPGARRISTRLVSFLVPLPTKLVLIKSRIPPIGHHSDQLRRLEWIRSELALASGNLDVPTSAYRDFSKPVP